MAPTYTRLWNRYKTWAEAHDAQLLELYDSHYAEPWVGFFVQEHDPGPPPNGLRKLAIRADDTNSDPCELTESVFVNRWGWFFTARNYYHPVDIDDWNFIS